MTSNHSASPGRLDRLTDTQLRLLYAFMALAAFIANVAIVLDLIQNEGVTKSDDCLWQTAVLPSGDSVVVVAQVIEGGNAEKAGVQEGDRVVAINGVELVGGNPNRAQEILNDAPTDVPIPYTVERNGEIITLSIEITKLYSFVRFVMPTFTLLWLIIGAMVVFAQPRGMVQRQFFFTAVTVIFPFFFSPATHREVPGLVLGILWVIAGTLFFPMWFRFCSIFPVDHKIFSSTRRTLLLFAPAVFILIPSIFGILFLYGVSIDLNVIIASNMMNVITRGLYFGAGVFFLWRGYRRLPTTADRRPVLVILIGSVIAVLAFLYFTLLATITTADVLLHPEMLLPITLFLALPVSFGYAIFKYQVMDFRLVVRTTLVYTVTMAMIAGLYVALGYGIGQALGSLLTEELQAPVGVVSFVLFVMLFEPVKRQVQVAIENRFFPQQRDYSAQLTTYSSQVAEMVGTKAVADLTARTLKKTLDLHGVLVALEDKRDDALKIIARECDFAPMYIEETELTHLRDLLRLSHGLIALETIGDPLLAPLQTHFSYAIGLHAQGHVIGAILMTRPIDNEPLSGSQTPFITGVAAQGASAIEVARLYEEELERQRYQEELATARRIQESLLPAKMPDFPGISISAVAYPAQAVGGDYYEVIRLDEHRFIVMIADVSGKGLPASLYMAELHGMVRIASAIHASPKEILSTLNSNLYQVIGRGSFITATLLLFDTQRKIVSYARAGHTPIIRRSSAKVDTLIPTGLPLGVQAELFDSYLQQYTVQYEPGETFILYSDGVSEAMNVRREEFGDGRLLDVISGTADAGADVVCEGILTRVEAFRDGAEQNDDITIVVIRIEKEVNATTSPVRPEPELEKSRR